MNKTEFRLLRESLHLSQTELSEIFQVNIRTVQSWEQGRERIPEKRINQLLDFNSALDFSAENFERQVVDLRKNHDAPDEIVLLAYKQEDYSGDFPHHKLHNALLMRCWHRARAMNYKLRIVLFNRNDYLKWSKNKDSQALRAQWASLQINGG